MLFVYLLLNEEKNTHRHRSCAVVRALCGRLHAGDGGFDFIIIIILLLLF